MRKSLLLIAPGLMSLLAACSMQPDYKRPALPTAADYPAETTPHAAGPKATQVSWQSFFKDPRLQAIINLALENNRDLRTAVLRIEEARAQYRIQRADRLPNVSVDGGITRSRTSAASMGGGSGFPSSGEPITGTRYEAAARVASFELDFWGRVRSLTDAARSAYLATVEAQRAFQIGLIADVATAYLTDRDLAERIVLAEQTVRSRTAALDIARARLEAGATSALDYRQTETLLTQAQAELATLQRQRAQNRNALELLVGRPLPADLPAALPLADQGIIGTIDAGLPSDLLGNRPDILAAEEQLRAANANIGAARAAFFPRISLTGVLGFASTELDKLFGDDGFTWSFGPNLSLPIFDAGRNQANLDLAKVRRNIAVANYEKTIQTAFREVADALAARRWLAEQIAAQERALAAEQDRAELAELRYRNGVAGYIEVLDAQRSLFATEQALVQMRQTQLSNAVALYVALGGGLAADGSTAAPAR